MPMGIEFRMSELRPDALLETLGDKMFKPLSLLVNFLDRVIEDFIEKRFDEPVMPKDLQSATLSMRREPHPATLLVCNVGRLIGGELLQHVGNRRGRDGEVLGQR